MRLRILDFGVDKYGLNAYIYDATNDGRTNYDRVLLSPTKDGKDAVGILRRGQSAGVKVKISGGTRSARPPACWSKSRSLAATCQHVRLFHTWCRPRHGLAELAGDANATSRTSSAQKFPTSTAADYAVLRSGHRQRGNLQRAGLVWETLYQPLLAYIVSHYQPDLLMLGYPTRTSSSTSSWASCRPSCRTAHPTPPMMT